MNRNLKIYHDLKTIWSEIASEKGPRMTYHESMAADTHPAIAALALDDIDFSGVKASWKNLEEDALEACRFQAENGNFFPAEMKESSFKEFREWMKAFGSQVLDEMLDEAIWAWEECFGEPYEETPHWDFLYDEEIWDYAGRNFAGVLSNGERFLFWHAFKDDEKDPVETCHIYSSIFMTPESQECSYPWTAENDALVTDALNGCSQERFCGEEGVLRTIRFKNHEEE